MTREVETGSVVVDQFPVFESDGFTKKPGLPPATFEVTAFLDSVEVSLPVSVDPIGTTGEYKISFTPGVNGIYRVEVFVSYSRDIWYGVYEAVPGRTNLAARQARDQAVKLDLVAVDPGVVAEGSLADLLLNKDANKTFDPSLHSLEAIADALSASSSGVSLALSQMQNDLARVLGLLHRNSLLDKQTYDGQGQLLSARLRVFDSPENVPSAPGGNETAGLLQQYEIEAAYGGVNVVSKFMLKQVL